MSVCIRTLFILVIVNSLTVLGGYAQGSHCAVPTITHTISSTHLEQSRDYWVSLPLHYDTSQTYPVIYLFDAEWRMGMVSSIVFDLGGNDKIDKAIVVGIPHVDWRHQRGVDLTFSHSRTEYDGEVVDSSWYNATNSGGAEKFYQYLTRELIPDVNRRYSTNGDNTLIGHSYGGYFGGYILGRDHPFTHFHIYDPSIWFSDGEVIEVLQRALPLKRDLEVFISYQPIPAFHAQKIEAFIALLREQSSIKLRVQRYENESHNSLFLPSLLEGLGRN